RDYRNCMTVNWDDSDRVEGYEEKGVKVIKQAGQLAGPGRVEAGDHLLEADHVLIATGSDPIIPALEGLQEAGFWTNRGAMEMQVLPESVVILGGGPVGTRLERMVR